MRFKFNLYRYTEARRGDRESWAAHGGGARARLELESNRRRAAARLGDAHWVVHRLLYGRAEVSAVAGLPTKVATRHFITAVNNSAVFVSSN